MTDMINTQENSVLDLFAGDFPRSLKPITIASGQGALAKGTVLGKITASGKYGAYLNTNSDGTETAKLILVEAVDATSADVKTQGYEAGKFNSADLTGYDAAAGVDFEGTPILIGTIV